MRAALTGVTGYHWLVFALASLGWLFDCTGQRLFVLSREPALRELLGPAASEAEVRSLGGLATLLMMVGWATGGIVFGKFSDRYGRVRAMVVTLVAFTAFSGLSALARTSTEFLLWRFPSGLGVGGMFGAATTMIAESSPPRFRTLALGSMQALSACGNMLASALSIGIGPGREAVWGSWAGWQVLFLLGVVPVVLALPMAMCLREPEPWLRAREEAQRSPGTRRVGRIADLWSDARWRRGTVIGVCLGLAGMVGLWGIAFFSPELVSTALKERPLESHELVAPAKIAAALREPAGAASAHVRGRLADPVRRGLDALAPGDDAGARELLLPELRRVIAAGPLHEPSAFASLPLKKATTSLIAATAGGGRPADVAALNRQLLEQTFAGDITELARTIDATRGRGMLLQDVGSLLGMVAFTFFAARFGRRPAFLIAFVLSAGAIALVFGGLRSEADVLWMLPLLGFGTMACFAGYAIYFPELFPARLRGTGVGVCYNLVRYLAAPFPFLLGWLGSLAPFRTVAIAMASIYVVGIVALVWAPETRGRPLPED